MPGLSKASHKTASQNYRVKLLVLACQGLILSSLALFTVAGAGAEEYQAVIRQADVRLQDDLYVLNADIDYPLSPAAKEALLKGIALSWDIPIIVTQQRGFLWDKKILELTLHYQIRYYALLNIYRIKADHNKQVNNFASLATALNSIATLRDIPVINKANLPAEGDYQVEIRVVFDRDVLPNPLRPMTYFDNQWFLSSEWYVCSLPK